MSCTVYSEPRNLCVQNKDKTQKYYNFSRQLFDVSNAQYNDEIAVTNYDNAMNILELSYNVKNWHTDLKCGK